MLPLFKGFASFHRRRASPIFSWKYWFFFCLTTAFSLYLGKDVYHGWRATKWPIVKCEILESSFKDTGFGSELRSEALIKYQYEVNGHSYYGNRIWPEGSGIPTNPQQVRSLVATHPVGKPNVCRVNPQNPREAVIETPEGFYLAFILLFPVGMGLFYVFYPLRARFLLWRLQHGLVRLEPLTANRPLARLRRRKLVIGLSSLIGSSVLFWFMVLRPWWNLRQAVDWVETPCRILVAEHRTDANMHGYSFEARLVYSYALGRHEHTSEERDFSLAMGASYANTRRLLEGFQVGTTNICFVNPRQYGDAVLRKEVHIDWFFAPLLLAWVGLSGFLAVSSFFQATSPNPLPWQKRQKPRPTMVLKDPPRLLIAKWTVAFLACFAIALWLLSGVCESLRFGGFDLYPAIFVMAAGFGAYRSGSLALAALRRLKYSPPILTCRPAILIPGEAFQISWQSRTGGHDFQLVLEGVEEATILALLPTAHGSITEEKLLKSTFCSLELGAAAGAKSGTISATVPAGAMHSFEARRSRIRWGVKAEMITHDGKPIEHFYSIIIRNGPATRKI